MGFKEGEKLLNMHFLQNSFIISLDCQLRIGLDFISVIGTRMV